MSAKRLSPIELNKLRRIAVQLRLTGETLASVKSKTGLSHPTIISAHKCFIDGGWEAVNTRQRGRPKQNAESTTPPEDCLSFIINNSPASTGLWTNISVKQWFQDYHNQIITTKTVNRHLKSWGISAPESTADLRTAQAWLSHYHPQSDPEHKIADEYKKVLKGGIGLIKYPCPHTHKTIEGTFVYAEDFRGKLYWLAKKGRPDTQLIIEFLTRLNEKFRQKLLLSFHSYSLNRFQQINVQRQQFKNILLLTHSNTVGQLSQPLLPAAETQRTATHHNQSYVRNTMALTHLERLEAESIQIMREVVSKSENPVMLYSIGKDSAVMLHLAIKAFYPSKPPFPLLHVDTGWKFRDMYTFRDKLVKKLGLELITYKNPEGVEKDINPFTHGSALHTDIMKTEGLKQALDKYKFDAAFGGARRDEEKSRAKERIFSFRTADHRWDPKNQRPELWKNYNANKRQGESIRVFPLSNWTELDIWQYIYQEEIPIVPLYLAAERPVVERDGTLIMVDDERMPLQPDEIPVMQKVRFRTLGCYPLTGAVESDADTLPAIIQEMLLSKTSERQGRMIDHDSAASMEKKKQEGYF
ncbi:sulfate adenylyltransferase subunit CysD [Aliamphritea hakodatensis]|uniref:sulfate adenylyltransferase subunit CysD n=1 Tax=Aliamphritea hakodatensis TaxID=2895352 RepID=UPI0022FD9679|nr:sulfate adenylyltransferase subunit CysD [Aliamphritea hakodatensis]